MLTATRLRLYPTPDQEDFLLAQFGAIRMVWNKGLAAKRHFWRVHGRSLSPMMDLKPLLAAAKRSRRYGWLKRYDAMALQQALIHLQGAFTNFFEGRARYPRFKSRRDEQSSYHCTGRIGVTAQGVTIPKLPGAIRAVVHREIIGKVRSITLTRTRTGKWFASVLTEDGRVAPDLQPVRAEEIEGLDMGVSAVVTTSRGRKVENPRFLQKALKKVRKLSRELARKQKGSKNRGKARLKLARAHEAQANCRSDFQHKVTTEIVRESQGAIAVETLALRNMLKNRRLARAIADVGIGGFLAKLAYKARAAGKHLVRIGRWEPSTKLCSGCGHKRDHLPLSVRAWSCENCGTGHDRDINAAKNIAAVGARELLACGMLVTAS